MYVGRAVGTRTSQWRVLAADIAKTDMKHLPSPLLSPSLNTAARVSTPSYLWSACCYSTSAPTASVRVDPVSRPETPPGLPFPGADSDRRADLARKLQRFTLFNKHYGKFRVGIINRCDFNCTFCHNEGKLPVSQANVSISLRMHALHHRDDAGMPNPRPVRDPEAKLDENVKQPGIKYKGSPVTADDAMLAICNAYTELGGAQLNITGGEPLLHPKFFDFMEKIHKRKTRIVLNSNIMLADRLLHAPKVANIDAIYASLHTTKEEHFKRVLGSGGAAAVMRNMAALKKHGYHVQINFSLGSYNKDQFDPVLDFALMNGLGLKVIAIIRPHDAKFYAGDIDFVDPDLVTKGLAGRGLVPMGSKAGFGGKSKMYGLAGSSRVAVEVKNIAEGRLATEYCNGCAHLGKCGEGMYAVRVGVDSRWKPCLMRKDGFSDVTQGDMKEEILNIIDRMVGNWDKSYFATGAPS